MIYNLCQIPNYETVVVRIDGATNEIVVVFQNEAPRVQDFLRTLLETQPYPSNFTNTIEVVGQGSGCIYFRGTLQELLFLLIRTD